jgi:hypothetical protein
MSISWRDRIATLLVGSATLIYGLWLIGPLDGLATGSVAIVVLVLGFLASASAVVPGFAALLSGSRLYLAIASLAGVIALTCGILTVVQATEHTLAILMIATIGLWAAATIRHRMIRPHGAIAIG